VFGCGQDAGLQAALACVMSLTVAKGQGTPMQAGDGLLESSDHKVSIDYIKVARRVFPICASWDLSMAHMSPWHDLRCNVGAHAQHCCCGRSRLLTCRRIAASSRALAVCLCW
jgi:hypothetical protein